MINFVRTHGLSFLLLILVVQAAVAPAPTNAQQSGTPIDGVGKTAVRFPAAPVRTTPSNSSPIAITSDDSKVVVVNPLNNSVTILNVAGDANQKVAEVNVGIEPQTVAISNDDKFAYVTNQGGNSVSVIDLTANAEVTKVPVGVEPYGIALTPDGARAYVVNGASGSVSILDTATNKLIASIPLPLVEPRGIAITANNAGAGPQFVYVTQFLSQLSPNGKEMTDNGHEGKVVVLSTSDDQNVVGTIVLAPHDTGFTSDRTAFGGGATDPVTAFPNQLQSIVLKNGRGYLPNIAASPQGPVKFDTDTQAFLSVFDTAAKSELSGGTINLNLAVKNQTAAPKLFLANPWAIDFKHNANEGYVVSAASNVLAKIALDNNGIPSVVTVPVTETNKVLTISVGKNPRGIVVNHADTRAYVMNFISRDVSAIDLTASPEKEIAKISSAALPPAGSDNAVTLLGNELFNTSVGEFDEGVKGRMSNNGWQACSSCHFEGLTDGVVWQFPAGPRKSIPLNASFDPKHSDTDQRVLNYSAIFDEVCDFEINIRSVSGGAGLIITDTVGANPPTAPHPILTAFNPPNCGRPQLHVGGVAAWDAITQWVAKKVRSPQSPYTGTDPNSELGQKIARGRQLFIESDCQLCHGGPKWSTSQVDFARTSPPSETVSLEDKPTAQVGFLARFLRNVGTFDASDPIEKNLANLGALGAKGFNPPSLLSIYAFPPYLHNGACPTLDCVVANKTHRDAGGKVVLENPDDRSALIEFLKSIDATTEPINASTPATTTVGAVGQFVQLGDSLNHDKNAAGTDQNIAYGTLFPGAEYITWATWAEKQGNTQQIFVSKQNGDKFESVGASLNIHTNVVAEKPSIDFAGQNRAVPWVTWYEPSPGFGNKKQVFVSRFNADSGLWVPSGQDRGGNEASLNIHTQEDAEDPILAGGSADPTAPPSPWVCWQEDSAHSNGVEIFVSRAVKDDKGLGGFRWVPVGLNRGGTDKDPEPSLNVDFVHSDGAHCWIVFAETNNTVPWVVWAERSGGNPGKIFVARGVQDDKAPGGFHWQFVPNCKGVEDSDKCVLNVNPSKDASDPFMTAGTVVGGASVPWLTWTEVGPTGKKQVFVDRLDPVTHDKFLNVGGSLNVNQDADAEGPSITFVGNVPYVAWSETVGSVRRIFVRHLESDPQTGTWALDTPKEGLAVDKTKSAFYPVIHPKGKGVEFIYRQGDPEQEPSQIIVCTNAVITALLPRIPGLAAPFWQGKTCQ